MKQVRCRLRVGAAVTGEVPRKRHDRDLPSCVGISAPEPDEPILRPKQKNDPLDGSSWWPVEMTFHARLLDPQSEGCSKEPLPKVELAAGQTAQAGCLPLVNREELF